MEVKALTRIILDGDFPYVLGNGINHTFFSGEYRKMFKFLEDFYKDYKEIPSEDTFSSKFPDFNFYVPREPLKFFIDELKRRREHMKMQETLSNVAEDLDNGNISEAKIQIRDLNAELNSLERSDSSLDIKANVKARMERYQLRKEAGGIVGIRTGFAHLDYALGGLQKEQLISILAKTGVGKTYLETCIGSNALLDGHNVLQFTTEMSAEKIQDRYDFLLASLMLEPINLNRFRSGTMTSKEEKIFQRYLEQILPRLENNLFIEKIVGGVGFVASRIEALEPDIVLIDSAYLMEDDRSTKADDWLRVAHITRDLKQCTNNGNRKIPIVINTQADRTTSVKTGPEIDNIGYSRALGEDSDIIIGMFQSPEMRMANEMGLKLLKHRDGNILNLTCSWDFEEAEFSSLYCTDNFINETVQKLKKRLGVA